MRAPALAPPRLMTQHWRDVAFLHWAVDPGGSGPVLPARSPARRSRRPHLRRAHPLPDGRRRVRRRPGRAVGGHVPRDQRAALLGRRHRAARDRVPQPGRRPRRRGRRSAGGLRAALPLGPDALPRRRRRAHATPPGCGGRPAPPAASRSGRAVRPPMARWSGSSPPAGGCTSPTWAAPGTSPTPTRRGRCATAELLALDDGLVAAAGLGDLARRPPDHVAFSDGVAVEFGLPTPADRPRADPRPAPPRR